MTDQEIVDGLINRDEKITDWFFNIKYRPLFINVIKLIFDYQVDYDECISELYYHLMKNDAAAKIDLERLFDLMSNKRYVMVIRELVLKEVEPEFLALSMGITVANLYNIKKRALATLAHLALNDKKKYENKR